jgi:eukaryotic-like serine/threonine-protein kinase
MSFWRFIFSRYFLKQLVLAASVSIVIIWVVLRMLDIYTLHGRRIEVPELESYQLEDAKDVLLDNRLRYVVNDSIFDLGREPGSVAMQDPAPGTEVKRNRTIYLTTVAVLPEMVPMPDLTDLSRRQAMSLLETHGLAVGRIEYRPDIARNAVLEQKFKDGIIEPGSPVAKGTSIDLVLGEGLGENITIVPFVIGLSPTEAARTLISASLNVGREIFMGDSTDNARVYIQEPDPIDETVYLQAGSSVDLFYRSADVFDFEAYIERILSVPIPYLIGKTPDEVRIMLESKKLEVGRETFEDGATRENAVAIRQEPEYETGVIIPRGQEVNIWYEPAEDIDNDDLNDLFE